jgi:hypothetical protein
MGLDEIDPEDGPFNLLSLVKLIFSPSPNKSLKVCVSSRPETSFKLDLERCPKLRLQDLTRRDMEVCATDFLRTKCLFNFSDIDENRFVREIVTKSEGVFLWVSLALKSLQRGFINGDDPSKLIERLNTLPSELEKLYGEMIKRLGDDQEIYGKEAAFIFNLFIFFSVNAYHSETNFWNLLQYAVTFDPILRNILLKQRSTPSPKSLRRALLDVDRKLTSRYAGLLEVVSYESDKNIEYVLFRDSARPWCVTGIQYIHRSTKDFLLSMKHKLLDQDITTATERKSRVLQAITLEDLYWDDEVPRRMDQCTAMDMMLNTEPILSDTEELNVLKLIQEVYERNCWPEFYEVACRYGCYQPSAQLLKSSSGHFSALLNYLLLCALSGYITASYFLDMGADPNYIAFIPARHYGALETHLYLPTPLFSLVMEQQIPRVLGETIRFTPSVVEMVRLFIAFGADIERKFLSIELGGESRYIFQTSVTRPVYNMACFDGKGERVQFLVEINCIDLILTELVQDGTLAYAEKLDFIKQLGLNVARAHHKVLLCFRGYVVFGVNDEDSDAMNEIWDWALLRIPQEDKVDAAEDGRDTIGSDDSGNTYSSDTDHEYDNGYAYEGRFGKAYELLKGNKVHDIREWLSGRGYMLPEEKDFLGSSQASIHEMAEMYRRLNQNFALR